MLSGTGRNGGNDWNGQRYSNYSFDWALPLPNQLYWRYVGSYSFKMSRSKCLEQAFGHELGFWNCCRAIDGKHVQIKASNKSGTMFFNYLKTFSIVLLPICDASKKFICCYWCIRWAKWWRCLAIVDICEKVGL